MSTTAAKWRPSLINFDNKADSDPAFHDPHLLLIYRMSEILDINKCQMESVDPESLSSEDCFALLRRALAPDIIEREESMSTNWNKVEVIFGWFHDSMLAF